MCWWNLLIKIREEVHSKQVGKSISSFKNIYTPSSSYLLSTLLGTIGTQINVSITKECSQTVGRSRLGNRELRCEEMDVGVKVDEKYCTDLPGTFLGFACGLGIIIYRVLSPSKSVPIWTVNCVVTL